MPIIPIGSNHKTLILSILKLFLFLNNPSNPLFHLPQCTQPSSSSLNISFFCLHLTLSLCTTWQTVPDLSSEPFPIIITHNLLQPWSTYHKYYLLNSPTTLSKLISMIPTLRLLTFTYMKWNSFITPPALSRYTTLKVNLQYFLT